MVLPFFPSFLQVGVLCPLFCWVVLLCLFILWMVFLGGATFPLSSVGWCRLASFVGCCCVLPSLLCVVLPSFSSFEWGCFPSPLLLGGVAWPPSLGGVALFPLFLRGAAFLLHLPSSGAPLSPLLLGGVHGNNREEILFWVVWFTPAWQAHQVPNTFWVTATVKSIAALANGGKVEGSKSDRASLAGNSLLGCVVHARLAGAACAMHVVFV